MFVLCAVYWIESVLPFNATANGKPGQGSVLQTCSVLQNVLHHSPTTEGDGDLSLLTWSVLSILWTGSSCLGSEGSLSLRAREAERCRGMLWTEPELPGAAVRLSPRLSAPGIHLPRAGKGLPMSPASEKRCTVKTRQTYSYSRVRSNFYNCSIL